jgi:hypothetical protein
MSVSYLWYLAAVALVAVMVNTFELWRAFNSAAESLAGATPVLFALVALAGAAAVVLRRGDPRTLRLALLGGALVVAAVGLAMTDPRFPPKRVHVPEYIAVAWLVYQGLGGRLGGPRRAAAAVLLATLLGVHEELAQGLHPQRTLGALDMAVNGLGSIAGALTALAMTAPLDGPDSPGAWRHVRLLALILLATLPAYPLIAAGFGLPFE